MSFTKKILIITGVSINIILFANSLSTVFLKVNLIQKEYLQSNSTETENTEQNSSEAKVVEFEKFIAKFNFESFKAINTSQKEESYIKKFISEPIFEINTPPPDING